MIRFEREGEERFAHWVGGEGWRLPSSLERLFAEAATARETAAPVASAESADQ